jgi:probable RNA-binding protein EIF1AD
MRGPESGAVRITHLGSALPSCSEILPTPPATPSTLVYDIRVYQTEFVSMARPKRNLLATIDSTVTPPDTLAPAHQIARITTAAGNNLYNAELPDGKPVLAELEAKFRSTVWIKRGSYVVVDLSAMADRENKLDGEIVNVVRDEKAWRKMSYWYVYTCSCSRSLGIMSSIWYKMLIYTV